jgi:hypothetical protein
MRGVCSWAAAGIVLMFDMYCRCILSGIAQRWTKEGVPDLIERHIGYEVNLLVYLCSDNFLCLEEKL